MKRFFMTTLLISGILFSAAANQRSDLTGREIVEAGKNYSVKGTLSEVDGEWFVESGSQSYAIHLGNEDYLESINFKLDQGSFAEISGFLVGSDISVATITSNGKTWVLRDATGRPVWAGNGRRRNQNE